VKADAMRPLLDLMADPESGMVDTAAYVLHSSSHRLHMCSPGPIMAAPAIDAVRAARPRGWRVGARPVDFPAAPV
jgi:hypothetical protein